MTPTPLKLTRTAVVLGLAATFGLSACATPVEEATGADTAGAVRVVTTTTQLTDFAAEIGGSDIELQGLLRPGSSAHHFDPTPADLLALGQADVLVVNGVELESFIDSAIEASGFDGEIITASDGVDLEELGHGEESSHDGHDHEEQGHDGHDHGPVNPHIWTSPSQARGMAAEVASGLEKADPAHAEDFKRRAADYDARLAALDAWLATQFERVPEAQRVLVTGHDSLSYFLADYDIAFAGAILPSFEDNAEPSASEIDALINRIKEAGVTAIFVESSMSPKLARTIARESGAQVIDAESLFADALGGPGSGAETYIDATAHNARVILEAWGFDPDPLPQEIAA